MYFIIIKIYMSTNHIIHRTPHIIDIGIAFIYIYIISLYIYIYIYQSIFEIRLLTMKNIN